MSREAMLEAWNAMPAREQNTVRETREPLLGIAEQIKEGIIGIMTSAPDVVGFSALVITEEKIVECKSANGSLSVLRYAELRGAELVGGGVKKGLFGTKYSPFYLRLHFADGRLLTHMVIVDKETRDWKERMGNALVRACQANQFR